jgi:hypothetical protein
VHAHNLDFKKNGAANRMARVNKIFNDFTLAVDRDGATGQIREIDAMRAASESQVDTVMHQSFALHPLADSYFGEQVSSVLLEKPGANALLTIFPTVYFEHNGVDTLEM